MRITKKARNAMVTAMLVDVFGQRVADWEAEAQALVSEQAQEDNKERIAWFDSVPPEYRFLVAQESRFKAHYVDKDNREVGLHPRIEVLIGDIKRDVISEPFGSLDSDRRPYDCGRIKLHDPLQPARTWPRLSDTVSPGMDALLRALITEKFAIENAATAAGEQFHTALLSVTTDTALLKVMPGAAKYLPKPAGTTTALVPAEVYDSVNALLAGGAL